MARVSRYYGEGMFGSRQSGTARVTYERDFVLSSTETHKITGLYLDDLINDFWLDGDVLMRRIDAEGRGSDWDEVVKDLPSARHELIVQAIRFRATMTRLCVMGATHQFNAKGRCGVCHHQQPREERNG
jgi:hypothetical protein